VGSFAKQRAERSECRDEHHCASEFNPYRSKKRLERGVFLYSDMGREPQVRPQKLRSKLFVGSFAKQRPEGRAEHRCASVLILFFIVKPTFYKVELLLYNFKVRLYANIYIVLT